MLESLGYVPDPDNDGWLIRSKSYAHWFLDVYGEMAIRAEGPSLARLRMTPRSGHRNLMNTVHGGFLLAVIDHVLFVGPAVIGIEGAEGGSTIDLTTQFLAPVKPERAIDVLIETLRETYRMVFVRGLIEQDGVKAVAFSGTIKKASRGK
jgi:acyl-coenzyme A thioesterase PaaI-like protein